MAHINYLSKHLFLLLAVSIAFSCRTQKVNNENLHRSWKEEWNYVLLGSYIKYKHDHEDLCRNKEVDFFADFARKLQSIKEYPYDLVLSSVQDFVKLNRIEFDSVLMKNISNPVLENIDYSCPWTYFYFINKGDVISVKVSLDFCESINYIKVTKNERNLYEILSLESNNGCSSGYISYTWFDKIWSWEIKKISINPDNVIKSD